MPTTTTKRSTIKKRLKKELVSNRKYKTTYKDIKKFFTLINRVVFNDILAPFNEIKIKKIYDTKKKCFGQVVVYEWKRKGTTAFHLEMCRHYKNKKEFIDTLGHEMVHHWQLTIGKDTGNHNDIFYKWKK